MLGLDKSTMSRTVNTMIRHGLVARELHPGTQGDSPQHKGTVPLCSTLCSKR
ncbi:MAG: helix-turn-helix domain-containing protein [Syntrophaceticus sp.]